MIKLFIDFFRWIFGKKQEQEVINYQPVTQQSATVGEPRPLGKRFYTSGAAAYLGKTVSALEHMRRVKSGPKYYSCGRNIIYYEAHLREWARNKAIERLKKEIGEM